MFKWYKKWKESKIIKVGDILVYKDDNPFDITKIEVIDIKKGWVQYKFLLIKSIDVVSNKLTHSSSLSFIKRQFKKLDNQ